MKILLLEDDKILADSIKEYLAFENYVIDIAASSEEVFDRTYNQKYDLYIFDVNVPGINGFEILKTLREIDDITPTIFTTAVTDISSISKGFKYGADDYIKKPFDPEELVIRIKSKYLKSEELFYEYKHLTYDVEKRIITYNNEYIRLGKVQLEIFHILICNQGTIIEASKLMTYLENENMNALRVNISKIKAKLDINIINIRSEGYMLEAL